jgi:hypothetical protein
MSLFFNIDTSLCQVLFKNTWEIQQAMWQHNEARRLCDLSENGTHQRHCASIQTCFFFSFPCVRQKVHGEAFAEHPQKTLGKESMPRQSLSTSLRRL